MSFRAHVKGFLTYFCRKCVVAHFLCTRANVSRETMQGLQCCSMVKGVLNHLQYSPHFDRSSGRSFLDGGFYSCHS